MYISKISLKNIRGFRELSMVCDSKQTLILGKNGTGKTTLLRAIALGLCDLSDAYTLLLEPTGSFITAGQSRAEIEIELATVPRSRRKIVITRQGSDVRVEQINFPDELLEEIWPDDPPPALGGASPKGGGLFVCAYGAGRAGVGSESKREYRLKDAVYSLFNYREPLLDPELTLRRLRDYVGTQKYDAILSRLKQGLGLTCNDRILLPKGGGIVLSGPSIGQQIPLEAWADGYRLTFNWLIDLYGWAMQADSIGDDGHIRGIVLVDEVEQHLHPSLQTEIWPRLAQIMPHVQLFATTHSPLVTLGASSDSVVILQQEADKMVRNQEVPDFSGYSAEDMLVDERLFDTPNVYTPDTNRKLSEYNELVEIPKGQRTPDQAAQLRTLAQELRTQQLPEVRQPIVDPALTTLLQNYGI